MTTRGYRYKRRSSDMERFYKLRNCNSIHTERYTQLCIKDMHVHTFLLSKNGCSCHTITHSWFNRSQTKLIQYNQTSPTQFRIYTTSYTPRLAPNNLMLQSLNKLLYTCDL